MIDNLARQPVTRSQATSRVVRKKAGQAPPPSGHQYSLTILFFCVLVAALLFASVARFRQVMQRRQLIGRIEAAGGEVVFDEPRLDAQGIYVMKSAFNDSHLQYVGQVHELKHLSLRGTGISDNGLQALNGLRSLRLLDVAETNLGDNGLRALAQFPKLQFLQLAYTHISDRGIKLLVESQSESGAALLSLTLDDCLLTDACVESLTQLRTLRYLSCRRTQLSATGVARLREALPKCRVIFDDSPRKKEPPSSASNAVPNGSRAGFPLCGRSYRSIRKGFADPDCESGY